MELHKKRENGAEEIYEEIMVKNHLKIMKYIKSHVQEAWRIPRKINDKQANATIRNISPNAKNER